MKKIGILIFVAALVIGLVVSNMFSFGRATGNFFNFSLNFKGVKGSGNMSAEDRSISGFHGIDVGGVYQVEITAQKEYSVRIEADDNLLPLIQTEVNDGILKIESERRISPKSKIRIIIGAPNIDKLEVSGVANVTLNDLKNSDLTIDSSGASKIKLTGETAKLTVDVSGATKIDAETLTAGNANIEASGACNVTVNVSGELRADASGASRIIYGGSPTNIIKDTSGASKVSPK
ncbi:MAG: DUF2807 domain-containing protein [Chloracidobacterium sp.]|nr:DUF2807 domain-containing protein [Chloracidobacterium sp.]